LTDGINSGEGEKLSKDWHENLPADICDGPEGAKAKSVVAIIGGGPAGLTAAYSLQKQSEGHQAIVLEQSDKVGGLARTETYKGFRFDIGGHRFFTKVRAVDNLWHEILPNDFLNRPRLSRIYYKGRYFNYPLKVFNALRNMGIYESARIMLSYAKWHFKPHTEERNFEQWVTNRFGGRLFWHFFKAYTEKVWGIPPRDPGRLGRAAHQESFASQGDRQCRHRLA
jgi:protoporphyrinogen oxidase